MKSFEKIFILILLISAVGEDKRTRLNIGINNAVDKTNNKDEEKDFDTANLSRKSKIKQNTPRYAAILGNIKGHF
jgi:hypothetical protein